MSRLKVESLFIYPIKGVRGLGVERATLEARGFENDRRWLATDGDGIFLTQRNCDALARIIARPVAGGLHLSTEDDPAGVTATIGPSGERRTVTVWKDDVNAPEAGAAANTWLSDALGRKARLFFMDGVSVRSAPAQWAADQPVSFADGLPLLIATTASLGALNREISGAGETPVEMARFRPNIIVSGADPWEEDRWRTLRIGDTLVELVKPCDRCVVTTKDPKTGVSLGKEPLSSLARIRRSADRSVNGVLFGWNAVGRKLGSIAVGDEVEIAEARPEGWPIA
ncbi:MAG: MOSC domain-containing protein [Parvularculaceae bacterium]